MIAKRYIFSLLSQRESKEIRKLFIIYYGTLASFTRIYVRTKHVESYFFLCLCKRESLVGAYNMHRVLCLLLLFWTQKYFPFQRKFCYRCWRGKEKKKKKQQQLVLLFIYAWMWCSCTFLVLSFLLFLFFSFAELKAQILGQSDLYVKSGSQITIMCMLTQGPHDLGSILWYKGKLKY